MYCNGINNKDETPVLEDPNEPVYFLDGIRVNLRILKNYDANEIAEVTVLKDANAIKAVGPEGKNGVIYVTTKIAAKNRYWTYLKSKSPDYQKAIPSLENEADVVYIINGKVFLNEYKGDLLDLNDSTFVDLKVIDEKQLISDYNISNKKWGIILKTK